MTMISSTTMLALILILVVAAVSATTEEVDTSSNHNHKDFINAMVAGQQRQRLVLDAHQRLLRSLQSSSSSSGGSSSCASLADTVQSCVNSTVGPDNSTANNQCWGCYFLKQEIALDDFRNNPTLDCSPLNDNVCTPVSQCACLEPCANEISSFLDCDIKTTFAANGIDLNCTISCTGTNTTITDDSLVNSTDDFVGGLCRGQEAAVKLCWDSMGSSIDQCGSCLETTQQARVSSTTTCSDLQQITCDRINTCQCVDECKTELLAMWNCDIDFIAVNYPQLETCDQFANCPSGSGSGGSSPSSSTTSGAVAEIKRGSVVVAAALAVAVTLLTALTTTTVA